MQENFAFNALTLVVGIQEGHLDHKNVCVKIPCSVMKVSRIQPEVPYE